MDWMPIIGENLARLEAQFIMSPGARFREGAVVKAPFYAHGDIVRVSNGQSNVFMVAAGAGALESRTFHPLNGPVSDIFEANDAAGLSISEENAIEYLRFFHDHLRDPSGERFVIMESLDGFCLIDKERQHRPRPADMRLVYAGSPLEQNFAFRSYVTYQGRLSAVTSVVCVNGAVHMLKDEPQGFLIPAH